MTPNLDSLRTLLVKAKAAKEGSRKLDAAVAVAFGTEDGVIYSFASATHPAAIGLIPTYTIRPYDLTAVMGLMKEGWSWRGGTALMWFEIFDLSRTPIFLGGSSEDPTLSGPPTPALALLIAVIKAHIYELDKAND